MDELAEILIVEDDATIRTILEMALLGAGFRRVRTAARGDEGLAEAKRLKPDYKEKCEYADHIHRKIRCNTLLNILFNFLALKFYRHNRARMNHSLYFLCTKLEKKNYSCKLKSACS
jgi:hypothetical protein